jgi:hypothetical protein
MKLHPRRSGIGDPGPLAKRAIAVKCALMSVGKNLLDPISAVEVHDGKK